jgi:hypothetical protein
MQQGIGNTLRVLPSDELDARKVWNQRASGPKTKCGMAGIAADKPKQEQQTVRFLIHRVFDFRPKPISVVRPNIY